MGRSEPNVAVETVQIINAQGTSSVVVICEHASFFVPPSFNNLGLVGQARYSHAAWDPGAMAVAKRLSVRLDAALVAAGVSRLVYDCNRPPEAEDAMPARSEIYDVPGNVGLSAAQRAGRAETYYAPFRAAVADQIARTSHLVIVTVHSFSPIYHGKRRAVEIGVLHDTDARLADAMLANAAQHTPLNVLRNQPYGPEDGVTHTLREHAIPPQHLNVMLEIRNDLIETEAEQSAFGDMIAEWVAQACAQLGVEWDVKCAV